jgi:hypothetical protein
VEWEMIIKLFWEQCSEFVVEGQDGFFIEATLAETMGTIVPSLNLHEKLKFEQMKEFYVAKVTSGFVHEGCYYFLVSRDAQAIKFESVAFMTSDLSSHGGKVRIMPDIPIAKIEDICAIDPAGY